MPFCEEIMAPISNDAKALIARISASRSTGAVRAAVDLITSELGVTKAHLARCLGKTDVTLHRWISGVRTPDIDAVVALDLIVDGLLRIRGDDLVTEPCPVAPDHPELHNGHNHYTLERHGREDVCAKCGHRQPASADLAIDQEDS